MSDSLCARLRRSRGAVILTTLFGQHGQNARATLCAFVFIFSSAAFAATPAAVTAVDDAKVFVPGTSSPANATATGPGLGSVTLFVGLALAAVGTWLVWRGRNGAPVGRDLRQLAIQETRSLGNRQFLVVASYQDKKFLLGVCPGRIEMLAPLAASAEDEESRA
jgi:flagellar protein FliO/FliZ